MKQILTLVSAMMLGVLTVSACITKSKSPITNDQSPITILVMDTTQALLNGAQVQIGKNVYSTSFDGRVVIEPAQWNGAKKLTVTCEGFNKTSLSVADVKPLTIVSMTPKPRKTGSSRDEGGAGLYYTLGATRDRGVMYKMSVMDAKVSDRRATAYAEYEMAAVEGGTDRPHILPAPVANDVTAGKLTAGEVNDFAKWRLWNHVLDSTHKQFVNTWKLEARERYTVQVVNKNGYPVANYPVNLTDKQGNTLFQTVTDNTGKAELWANLIVNGEKREVKEPQKFIVVDEPCTNHQSPITNSPSDVDVVFIFDATGSMGDELRYLQAEMKDVIRRASSATGGLAIRTGAVVYRDHGDEYVTRISRLTDDISVTQAFIDKQEANGGGDYPEAVPEALMAALNSSGWNDNARARIAFLVLDAPCHEDSVTLALLHDQILNAASMGVRLVPVVCSGLGESGELLLRTMALATNGTSFFLTDDSGIGHTHLKPTTDSLKVEHLNDMLVRTIIEFSYMPDCTGHWHEEEIENISEQFIPNPFDEADLAHDESIPHGPTTLYLLDVSGKLIYIYQGVLEEASDSQLSSLPVSLSTGVYFVKAFYDGAWHVKKILVH